MLPPPEDALDHVEGNDPQVCEDLGGSVDVVPDKLRAHFLILLIWVLLEVLDLSTDQSDLLKTLIPGDDATNGSLGKINLLTPVNALPEYGQCLR